MADFVAVLKKTIDGLGEATPETRARVYDKARATISAKLAAISPAPPQAVIDRQKASLEQAIKQIEAEYAAPVPAPEPPVDDFEAIMKSLEAPVEIPPTAAREAATSPKTQPETSAPAPKVADAPVMAPKAATPAPSEDGETEEALPPLAGDRLAGERGEVRSVRRSPSRGRVGLAAVGLIVLVFAGAAGYALWINRDEVSQTLGMETPVAPEEAAVSETTEPEDDVAANEPADAQPASPAAERPSGDDAVPKFTQRLNSDGTEIDVGPAGGSPGVGEGTSVAELTVQPPGTVPLASAEGGAEAGALPPEATEQPAPAGESQPESAVPVGQRAIFYEERTSASGGSAEPGSTVWSLVQESPGGDLPPEPAIRADVTIPGKEIQLRMTIRRNGDPTLPASHIVELIFLTPDNFEGGVIDNLLRMTMKETEESTGNPILGVPAKIGDGFFLIALSDGQAEVDANMQLFRRMKWIDVPIVYRSGRRALVTIERGIPGDRVFEEAVRGWTQAPANDG